MTNLQHAWELLWTMTDRELRARYKYTILGFVWLIVNPLIQMAVIGYIFTFFIKEPVEHYYYYLFSGLLTWQFFSSSLTRAASSVVSERSLIKKTHFPYMIIPGSIVLSNFINYVLALLLFCVPVFLLGTFSFARLPLLLVAVVLLFLFTGGLGLLTSGLNVRFRDVNFLVQALLIIWFYLTPILYGLGQIPQRMLWLWYLNPVTVVFQLIHYSLLGTQAPEMRIVVANGVEIAAAAVLGLVIFQNESKFFDDFV